MCSNYNNKMYNFSLLLWRYSDSMRITVLNETKRLRSIKDLIAMRDKRQSVASSGPPSFGGMIDIKA